MQSHARGRLSNSITLDWSQVKQIGIIVRVENQADIALLDKFISKLKKAGKKVSVAIIQSGSKNILEHPQFKILSDKDFTFSRVLKETSRDFLPKKSDLLISAGHVEDPRLVSCCVLSDARIKVSNQQGSPEVFDLIVPSELTSYVNILRTEIDILKSLSPRKETAKV